jgi:hypothetical protein
MLATRPGEAGMAKTWRCYLGFHRWVRKQTDDGKQYIACRDCNKEKDIREGVTPIG